MEKILINMSCTKTVKDIIKNVDSGIYNIVDEEDRQVSILVEKDKGLETRTMKEDGWILSMEYDENGEFLEIDLADLHCRP